MKLKCIQSITCCLFVLMTACQSTEITKIQDRGFHIINVDVELPHQTDTVELLRYSKTFDGMMTNALAHFASEYNSTRPNAKIGYNLFFNVDKVHFKAGLGSAVPGDANHVTGSASLVNPSDGKKVHTLPVK